MSKLFTVAGTSNLEGVVKFRVANGSAAARTKVLERSSHTDIQLQDLPKPMTKEDAIAFVGGKGQTITKGPKLVTKANAPKLKVVKTKATKEVPAKKMLADLNITTSTVTSTEKPNTKSMEEIAKIKAKNLETMRNATNKLRALREY
jgi:hypothetical protein